MHLFVFHVVVLCHAYSQSAYKQGGCVSVTADRIWTRLKQFDMSLFLETYWKMK